MIKTYSKIKDYSGFHWGLYINKKIFEELNKKNLEITSSNIDNVVFENLNYFKINNDIGQNTISGIEY